MSKNPFRYFNTSPEIIRLAVMMYVLTQRRDRKAALIFLKKAMKRYGAQKVIVTDRLASYRAAMTVIGNEDKQETARWANNLLKTHINHSDEESERCSDSGKCEVYKSSPRFMHPSTASSTINAISNEELGLKVVVGAPKLTHSRIS